MTKTQIVELYSQKRYGELISMLREEAPVIKGPSSIQKLLSMYGSKKQEYFLVVTLDGAHAPIAVHEITKGIADKCMVHPREVFATAISDNAVAIVIAHNHPSGAITPSQEDCDITNRIEEASEIMGIDLLDHIVIGRGEYYSFKEHGLI